MHLYLQLTRSLAVTLIWLYCNKLVLRYVRLRVSDLGQVSIPQPGIVIGPLGLVSSHTIWGPLILRSASLLNIWGPGQISFFDCYRWGGGGGGRAPQISFFTKYMGAPQISISATIWGPYRLVIRLLYGASQVSFCAYFFWPALSDQFFLLLYGTPQINFLLTIWIPLRSVSLHTIWRPQISFFAYYMGPC